MKKNKIVSVSLSEKDFKKLRSQAFKNEVSLSSLIRQKLGIEDKIEDENFDPLVADMNKKIEKSKAREDELKAIKTDDFSTDFSSPPSFERQ